MQWTRAFPTGARTSAMPAPTATASTHWRNISTTIGVSYAELVRDPEATLREVFDFCGLEREPGCGDITRNAAPSATLSAAQVRAPLHARSFDEWRRYEARLSDLAAALGTDVAGAVHPPRTPGTAA